MFDLLLGFCEILLSMFTDFSFEKLLLAVVLLLVKVLYDRIDKQ